MKYLFVISWLFFVFPFQAHSEEEFATDIASRMEHSNLHFYINDDGTHVETSKWEYTILKESALKRGKEYSFSYSTSVEKAEVIEAYTRKADGKRIEVPQSNYQVKVSGGKGKNSPLYSDRTRMTVVFPEVEVGDTVVFALKVTQLEPIFPGHISLSKTYRRTFQDNDVQVTIDAPATLWAQYEGRQMKENVIVKDGRKIIRWTYQNKKPIKSLRKDYSVYDLEKVPGFSYSTFKSYEVLAKAYGARALPKAVPTERVTQLANKIIKDAKGPREKAKALYEWVATNITYAGHCVGVGTVVPHDTDIVLDNRMGDCKDQTTLLQALLKVVGIDSTQALINAQSYYKLAKIPLVSSVNHVITYVPSFDLFLDPTASSTPFGILPFSVQDKPVLLVENYREGLKTPASPFDSQQEHVVNDITIKSDGSIRGAMNVTQKGTFAIGSRAQMRHLAEDVEQRLVDEVYKRMGYIGSGSFEKEDPKELLDTYSYKVKANLKNFIQRPGAGAFNIQSLFPTSATIQGFLTQALTYEEQNDVSCMGGVFSEEYTYHFPEDMMILAAPENVEIKNDFLSYRASYKQDGKTLHIKRILEDKTKGNVCSPEIMKSYQVFAAKALKNVKSQVVYR